MTGNNPNLDLPNIGAYLKFVLKILSDKQNLIPIKGQNSVTRKMTNNNHNLDLVHINMIKYWAETKFRLRREP